MVHERCLIEWLTARKRSHCEVCSYQFELGLDTNEALDRLGLKDLLALSSQAMASVFDIALRLIFVVMAWFIVLPLSVVALTRSCLTLALLGQDQEENESVMKAWTIISRSLLSLVSGSAPEMFYSEGIFVCKEIGRGALLCLTASILIFLVPFLFSRIQSVQERHQLQRRADAHPEHLPRERIDELARLLVAPAPVNADGGPVAADQLELPQVLHDQQPMDDFSFSDLLGISGRLYMAALHLVIAIVVAVCSTSLPLLLLVWTGRLSLLAFRALVSFLGLMDEDAFISTWS